MSITVKKMNVIDHIVCAVAVMILLVVTVIVPVGTAAAADLALIDATALKSSGAKYLILDARPKADWEAGHIPGALLFSWEQLTRTDGSGVKYSTLPPQELAQALANLGINEKTPLVLYGDADKSWGSEGYAAWLFSWLGHKAPVRVLNGGIQSWRSQNLPLVKGTERGVPAKVRYLVDVKPNYLVTTEDIQSRSAAYSLVDVRSTFEWLKGRIPGAIHIPWEDFYAGKDHHPLPPAELKKMLAKHGVDTSRPVAYYCLGGVRSAYAWTVHQLSGLPEAKNYKGSWAAWEKRVGQ